MTRSANARRQATDLAREVLGDRTGGLAPDVPVHSLRHQYAMQAEIQRGEPPFPHVLMWSLTIATAGVWGLVHLPLWLGSAQRRYRRKRTAALKSAGLL